MSQTPSDTIVDLPELEGYDLIDELGRGGMGVVYEAYQRSTGRRVAVKFMLDGVAAKEVARRRFEREVELVARLQHRHIVSVIDSGIHRGKYFCVLEYVEGKPLDQYLRPGECDVREALQLLATIAEGVDYAHQRGVLHRDLKPSNILIDKQGEPHILDFGLAKAIDPTSMLEDENSISKPGQLIGTLGYISPEQSSGEFESMSVRSDVYALGAIAYKVLTGRLPCPVDVPWAEVFRGIAERDPYRPSSVRKGLSSDVDAVLMKSLDKDPRQRYATAGDFSDEIHRCLNDEPIRARPPSKLRRAFKLVRRNKAVSAVTALAIIAIVGITAITTSIAFGRIILSRDEAVSALDTLKDTLLSVDVQKAVGPNASTTSLIDRLAETLETRLADKPASQASLRTTVGEIYLGWEQYEKAEKQFHLALKMRKELFGVEHERVAESLHNLARPIFYLHRYPEAASLYQDALDMRLKLLGPNDPDAAETMHHLASTYREMKQFQRAEELYRQALAIRERHPENGFSIAATRNNLGLLMMKTGRAKEAEVLFLNALATLKELPEKDRKPLFEALTMQNLGECYLEQGMLKEAQERLLEALSSKIQLAGEDSLTVSQTLQSLAELRLKQNDVPGAVAYFQRALDIKVKRSDPEAAAMQIRFQQIQRGESAEGEAHQDQVEG